MSRPDFHRLSRIVSDYIYFSYEIINMFGDSRSYHLPVPSSRYLGATSGYVIIPKPRSH